MTRAGDFKQDDVIQNWVVERFIGEGGLGAVYRVRNRNSTDIMRAVKIIHPYVLDDLQAGLGFRESFFKEAEAVGSLSHPNICRVDRRFEEEGFLIEVRELLIGVSLGDILQHRGGGLPADQMVAAFREECTGIAHGHLNYQAHGDVKPENFLVCLFGGEKGHPTVKVLNFGMRTPKNLQPERGVDNRILHRPDPDLYTAPEVLAGGIPTAPSDVFSLGLIMYQALTGKLPYDITGREAVEERLAVVEQALAQGVPDPREHVQEIPEKLAKIVMACLDRDIMRRFTHAGAMGNALKKVLNFQENVQALAQLREGAADAYKAMHMARQAMAETPTSTPHETVQREQAKMISIPDWEEVKRRQMAAAREQLKEKKSWLTPVLIAGALFLALAGGWFGYEIPRRQDEAACRKAKQESSLDLWKNYAENHPGGSCKEIAAYRLDELQDEVDCDLARQAKQLQPWRTYLDAHPKGACHLEAKDRIAYFQDQADCENARGKRDQALWGKYLEDHAEGACVQEATEGLRELRADERHCAIAKRRNNRSGWRYYLRAHPQGSCVELAKAGLTVQEQRPVRGAEQRRIEADEDACAKAQEAGTRRAWERYLARHRRGGCVQEAKANLAIIQEKEDCGKARRANTMAAWETYLRKHAGGACKREANDRIAGLKAELERRLRAEGRAREEVQRRVEAARQGEQQPERQDKPPEQPPEEEQESLKDALQRLGLKWMRVSRNTFWMGCDPRDTGCSDAEKPRHEVHVAPFRIMKTEATVGMYKLCVDAGRCEAPNTVGYCNWTKAGRENHPINCVNWFQADAFCRWLGAKLPREAEWELTARGTSGKIYPWGNQRASCDYAVMRDQGVGCGKGSTWPVCSKLRGRSPFGACDLAGNVSEWVADRYSAEYYANSAERNPTGPTRGTKRVARGGSWDYGYPRVLRTSNRYSYPFGFGNDDLGFRCVIR